MSSSGQPSLEERVNDHDRLADVHRVVLGNGTTGLVGLYKALNEKWEDHMKWHLAQRALTIVAIGGWFFAVVAGLFALL